MTWRQCFDRAKAFNASVHYDGQQEAPWFRYTDAQGREHEVWFENADSTKAKLDAVKASGIRGVYLWMYGGADERAWDQLATSCLRTLHRLLARTWHHADAQPGTGPSVPRKACLHARCGSV
ncbi:MAG: hypothetical protein ACRDQI_13285 [Pseudonocardiaceae bacterium]